MHRENRTYCRVWTDRQTIILRIKREKPTRKHRRTTLTGSTRYSGSLLETTAYSARSSEPIPLWTLRTRANTQHRDYAKYSICMSVSAAPLLRSLAIVGATGAACCAGGARTPGQGNAAIAAAEPRWLPRRAFGDTAPPLTEGTSGARRPRARAAPGAPVCSPRRGTCAHGRRRPLTASAARVGHRSPVAMHPYPMCAHRARLCTQANQLRQSCWPVRDL